jgi:hypothetical protein
MMCHLRMMRLASSSRLRYQEDVRAWGEPFTNVLSVARKALPSGALGYPSSLAGGCENFGLARLILVKDCARSPRVLSRAKLQPYCKATSAINEVICGMSSGIRNGFVTT